MADKDEVVQLIERLETATEELAVRGLRAAGPAHLGTLTVLRDEQQVDRLLGTPAGKPLKRIEVVVLGVVKPELDKDVMSETFLRYKGAEAGEIDWRPTP
ncbi:MAG: hypothetical protein ACYC6Y_06030 [Thermoguttaceae bacterium]